MTAVASNILRMVAGLVLLALSVAGQVGFDKADAPPQMRLVCLAVILVPLAIALIWFALWMKRADEAQRMVMRNRAFSGMMSGIGFVMIWHILARFHLFVATDFSVMSLPAYIIFTTTLGGFRQPERYEYR